MNSITCQSLCSYSFSLPIPLVCHLIHELTLERSQFMPRSWYLVPTSSHLYQARGTCFDMIAPVYPTGSGWSIDVPISIKSGVGQIDVSISARSGYQNNGTPFRLGSLVWHTPSGMSHLMWYTPTGVSHYSRSFSISRHSRSFAILHSARDPFTPIGKCFTTTVLCPGSLRTATASGTLSVCVAYHGSSCVCS